MKKIFTALGALAFGFGAMTSAQAATVDLSGVGNVTNNVRNGGTKQDAFAIDINVGDAYKLNLDNSATNLVNTALADITVNQADLVPTSFLNGSLILNAANNLSLGPVTQLAVAGSGTGAISTSNITNAALNSVNLGSLTVKVKQ